MKISNSTGGVVSPKTSKKKTRRIILILAIVILAVALFFIGAVVMKYAKAANELKMAKSLYSLEDTQASDVWVTPDEIRNNEGITKDFEKLHEMNDDIIGWLSIPDTKLDLPVALGDDNVEYLNKSIEKKNNAFGVPFVDYRATLVEDYQSTNLTIYGHASKDGSYFAPIKDYKDIEFYKEHPTVTFNTLYGKGEYKIIGAFMEDVRLSNPKRFAYHDKWDMNGEELAEYVAEVDKRSYFTTDVDVQAGDNLITLSTCDTELDGSTSTPYRIVLVARKVREGENLSVNVDAAQVNQDMIMPDDWIKKNGKQNPYE